MRTIKALLSVVLLVFSLAACSSTTTYMTYTLNPTKTFALVKSYLCEDAMNDDFVTVANYLAQTPTKCQFSTLELSASAQSASIHAIYAEPNFFTFKPDGVTDVDIPSGSITELIVDATLSMPTSFKKGEAGSLLLSVTGSQLYDKINRKIASGIYTELIIRPMTVIEKHYQVSFTDPWTTVDTEFDASANPWQLKPIDAETITSFQGDMLLTIPESVNTKTICLVGRLVMAHFEYILFMYYEGKP